MNRHQHMVSAVLAAMFGLQCALAASAAEKTEDGWELHQTSQIVGSPVVYLTRTGIKIVHKKSSLKIVAVPPDWKVFLYNDLNKVCFECPIQKFNSFIGRDEAAFAGNVFENLPFVKDSRVQILQLDAIKYKTAPTQAKRAQAEFKDGLTDRGAVQQASYCLADKLGIPDQEGLILAKFYGLTALAGVPLQFKYVNLGNESRTRLYTTLCQRKPIALSEFVRPKGYRLVKNVQEVSIDISQTKGFDDMMEGLGHIKGQ